MTWIANFEPEEAGQEQELVGTFEDVYSSGLEALRQKVEQNGG